MKTRQEMVYDFMLVLASNGGIYKDWDEFSEKIGPYADHIKNIADDLANEYLGSLE